MENLGSYTAPASAEGGAILGRGVRPHDVVSKVLDLSPPLPIPEGKVNPTTMAHLFQKYYH